MAGDGVNDVPALREADCSVTVQAGSDAARAVSQIVLMNNDFASMPLVVQEGRRCINNIQRSAALFLTKTIFAFLLAVAFLFLPYEYPFKPIQMTLVSALTIGAPSFLLALEPNRSIVRGSFLKNVLWKAAPGGISAALGIGLIMVTRAVFDFPADEASTMSLLLMGAAFFGALFGICLPFNKTRAVMFTALAAVFCLVPIISPTIRGFFYFELLSVKEWAVLGVLIAIVWILEFLLSISSRMSKKFKKSS